MKTQIRKQDWTPPRDLLPIILGTESRESLKKEELTKLALFEKALGNELAQDDSIEQSVTKIVKLALAAEFGPSLVAAKGTANMVTTISRAIMSDAQLKKQALVIIDRFTNA